MTTFLPLDLVELRATARAAGKIPDVAAFVSAWLTERYAESDDGRAVLARIYGKETIAALTEWCWSDGGPLSKLFELRQSQRTLALMAARSADGDGWALAEAPTGTGKGLAYLVPGLFGALRAERDWLTARAMSSEDDKRRAVRRKLIVSTANIALQEQLMTKDIPGVAAMLGIKVRATLLKGRNNYLCLDALGTDELFKGTAAKYREWADTPGCTGDRESLPFDGTRDWHTVSRSSDECIREACRFYKPGTGDGAAMPACFAERARAAVDAAHIVVTNHAYLARLAVSGAAARLPAVLLAVDEAHVLEDNLRGALAVSVGKNAGQDGARLIKSYYGEEDAESLVTGPVGRLNDAALAYLDSRGGLGAYPKPVALAAGWARGLENVPALLRRAADRVMSVPASEPDERARVEKAEARLRRLSEEADALIRATVTEELKGRSPGRWAMWAVSERNRTILQLSPASIAIATRALHYAYPRAVLTSATFATGGKFDAARLALGIGDNKVDDEGRLLVREEAVLPSPFDLPNMGALVVPPGPDPKAAGWDEWATDCAVEAVISARGRTLVLCSTGRMMQKITRRLQADARVVWPVRVQGESGRGELRRWFKECVEGVLVATRSFFEGLDVQGESLSCVVIDKVPFAPPGDPLEDEVCKEIVDLAGGKGSAFSLRSIPKACETLAQGAGRLIRAHTDRGAIVVLDNRVLAGGWATPLRMALPPFPLSRSIADVGRAIDGEPLLSSVQSNTDRGTLPVSGAGLTRRKRA